MPNFVRFERFSITRKLPAGGMGRVYEAIDTSNGRRVALKMIDRGTDADTLQVLAAERLGVELHKRLYALDPRITAVYDTGETSEYLYIVMEYVDGQDLSELAAIERIGYPFAARIAQDVLEVLSIAHDFGTVINGHEYRGIVHGDIKPRNIRLTTVGQVKVLDFGIAKALSLTRSFTQNVFGSVQYSSPERRIRARSPSAPICGRWRWFCSRWWRGIRISRPTVGRSSSVSSATTMRCCRFRRSARRR